MEPLEAMMQEVWSFQYIVKLAFSWNAFKTSWILYKRIFVCKNHDKNSIYTRRFQDTSPITLNKYFVIIGWFVLFLSVQYHFSNLVTWMYCKE